MQKFLAQFPSMSPAMLFAFDNFIYAQGHRMLGRTSGMWTTVQVGDVVALQFGERDNVNRTADGKVIMTTLFGQRAETDDRTASVAFTMLVVNWFWNQYSGSMSDAANAEFERVHFGLADGAHSGKLVLDRRALFDLTD